MGEVLALVALAASLIAAVARRSSAPDWLVAVIAAAVLVAAGVISFAGARAGLGRLGPTVGFLAALLVLADGCRRQGVFDALGAAMARSSAGDPTRLLAIVFAVAAGTTAVLSLDATILLLTPVVFATAAALRLSPRPHVYACSHLANTASLLLPVSNLTNLLAFAACRISFVRFGALMALPWGAAIAIEWIVLRRAFASELRPSRAARERAARPVAAEQAPPPWFALAVVGLTLTGFALSSAIGVAPVWFAVAGATVLTLGGPRPSLAELAGAAEPGFLVFVLALGVIVDAAGHHGLSSAVRSLFPRGTAFPQLLAIAALSAVLANLVNNLPATLIALPVVSANAPGAVLAMLIGVGIGPNLTYVGSLATLLWRRVVHAHDGHVDLAEFVKLGLLTVPASLVASTAALWLALQVI